ncbi:MAG: BtrH N-terminal domain-containing protein [Candidatus Marinimicrobia bacterium]|nr:BtrH N-terminal domain-containing protein [Candidatus Neomarinimicrobiota bacterium]
MKKLNIPHKKYDYLCPINGISDVYEWKTGKRIPDPLLFCLSSIGFTYIRQKRASIPRMAFWGSGIGKRQYGFLADTMDFQVHSSEGTTFPFALKKAQKYIEAGIPVVLFGLDMYYLPYFEKYYRTVHIPGHVILMVGYCDEDEVVYVHENSKTEVQTVSYRDLMSAWCEGYMAGQAKKNALFAIQFNDRPSDAHEIVKTGLKKRAKMVLNPPVKFLGIPGMRLLSADFMNWEKEMNPATYIEALKHFVTFTSSVVPALPRRLSKFDSGIPDDHRAMRDKFADILTRNQSEYGNISWEKAADLFKKSGGLIGQITEMITEYILDNSRSLKEIPGLLGQSADYEEEAFTAFLS